MTGWWTFLRTSTGTSSFSKTRASFSPFLRNGGGGRCIHSRALRREIALAGGRTLLFMTWGYKNGDEGNLPGDTFDAMQARLAQGYAKLGAQLNAPVAPVGLAWAEALRREPGLDLWARDGEHPNASGSFLAACVLYRLLSGRDPSGSVFTGGVPLIRARFLQDVADDVVRAELAALAK